MRDLLYYDNVYYLSDNNPLNGKTLIINYIPENNNLPHTYFKNNLIIYGKLSCPYCIKLIQLVKNNDNAIFINIDKLEPQSIFNKQNLLKLIDKENKKKHNTIPIIFNNTTFIGGLDDYIKSIT